MTLSSNVANALERNFSAMHGDIKRLKSDILDLTRRVKAPSVEDAEIKARGIDRQLRAFLQRTSEDGAYKMRPLRQKIRAQPVLAFLLAAGAVYIARRAFTRKDQG